MFAAVIPAKSARAGQLVYSGVPPLPRGAWMIETMAQMTLATLGSYTAGGIALASAVVAQNTQDSAPPVATGAMALGLASLVAAAGPHLMAAFKLWIEDRRDARSANTVEVVNRLRWADARLAHLEKIASSAEELQDKAREVEIRYAESQDQLEELREIIAGLIPPVAENQADLRKIAEGWPSSTPPSLKAEVDPSPLPPPPVRSGSSSGLNLPVVRVDPDIDPESAIGGAKP